MKKLFLIAMSLMLSVSVMAQQKIQLHSTDQVECVNSDMTGLRALFSFSGIGASIVQTSRGELSEIHIEGTFPNGNVGEPQLPMFTRLIAIPTGATPVVSVGGHSETEYSLSDYGIGTVSAMQAPVRKNVDPSTVEYAFNEAAYARNSYNDAPIASVEVLGTMRGITLGRLIVQPVRYNPAAGTVKVFNDIEVSVDFQDGDAESTARMFKSTSSPAFNSVYDQIFNFDMLTGGGTRDAYTDHPDLYNTPVKMLVICYSGFQGNAALNSWLEWKLQKGYYVDIYYTGSGTNNAGTTASAIATFIKTKYNASVAAGNAYTYLIVIGDTGQVPYYTRDYEDSTAGYVASDLGYASIDFSTNSNDVFPDMYYSRMSVENTTHLTNYINKVLTYEKFEFTDGGNYLNNVILVGGWDDTWTSLVARPTINYATTYYFNSNNTTYGGFSGGTINATISTSNTQGYSGSNNGCYQGINNGACFVNYTAHGNKQEWSQPLFTAAQVATLSNTGKYFFAVGNCCLSGNYNSTTTTYSPGSDIGTNACFGETMIRVPNAGAIAYIGCSDYTIWMEDYYWAVGSGIHFNSNYNLQGTATTSNTTTGVYDAMFRDDYWNSASSLLFVGNIAVTAAENNSNGYDTDAGYKYYFKYYHTFGDGSVMPYVTKPETNTVSIPSTVVPGTTSINVNALAGSYVAITDNSSVIYGVGVANASGVATVNFTQNIPATGTLYVVVTRQQYQPYFGTIQIVGGTQYNITVNQPQHGTISAPGQAYASATVTLEANPETGYCLSAWDVRDASNHSISVTNNQFTMPESNVTVTATFVQGLQVTLASVMHGNISANPTCALQGTTINLTATPASGYNFDSWIVYKTGDVNTTVTVNGNSFTMPNYPVTVSAIFSKPAGGEVTIGSGAGTDAGSDLPTDVYYKYCLTQQIYTSAELGSAGTITNISFYYNSSTSSGSRTLDIYMAHTSNSTITSWQTQSNSNKVYSGSHTFTQGWNTITLTTPFEYNGTSNLLLTVDDNTGSYSVNTFIYFYTYSTGANRAIYYRNDNNNPSATGSNSYSATKVQYNAQMKVTKEVPSTEGYLSVAPTTLSGFIAVAGSTASDPQSVSIIGSNLQANLTVTAPTGYEVCTTQNGAYNSTLTLAPSNGTLRTNMYVRLAASNVNPGDYSGNLTLASGTATATVSLSGNVLPGNIQYPVTVAANPPVGGNVTGAGEFNYNTPITVTATANQGYTFINWTVDGTEVSTEATYSFNVTGAIDLVANFSLNSYELTATPAPVEGGTVTLGGIYNGDPEVFFYDFEDGTSQGWTILQGPSGDSPDNWMHCSGYPTDDFSSGYGHNGSNGFMLSESLIQNSTPVHPDNYLVSPQVLLGGSVSFWATNLDNEYGAEHFAVSVSTESNTDVNDFTTVEEWTLPVTRTGGTRTLDDGIWYEYTADLSDYSGMGYVAIRHFDCYEQWLLCIDDISLVEGYTGTCSGTFNHGETCVVTATSNENYIFVNWTQDGNVVSSDASYSFTVTDNAELVANFAVDYGQTVTLSQGWNWWTPTLEVTLEDLETALGSYGLVIKTQTQNVTYEDGEWAGDDIVLTPGQMYKIKVNASCSITLNGAPASNVNVTINQGNNWFGYTGPQGLSIENALLDFIPAEGDIIKTASGNTSFEDGEWVGDFESLQPGQGYIYVSQDPDTKQFHFPGNN